jgi:dTDP-4-dehydrorhamnose 3,5-epimerase-like enzyme
VRGSGKFVIARAQDEAVTAADAAGKSLAPEAMDTFILSERQPSLLVVPPGHWHGWMALEDQTLVLATGSEVYNRSQPDEVRVSPDVFGDVWTVKGR